MVFSIIWLSLVGRLDSWWQGLPAVMLAVWAREVLAPPLSYRLRISGILRLLPFFLWRSLQGGLDVARRAFHPALPLDLGFVEYRLALPEGAPRVFMVNVLTLLPGTIAVLLEGDRLMIHALDKKASVTQQTRMLEQIIANVFKLPAVMEQGRSDA